MKLFWEVDVQYVRCEDNGINRMKEARILVSADTLQHAVEIACSCFRFTDVDSIAVRAVFPSDITHIGRINNVTD